MLHLAGITYYIGDRCLFSGLNLQANKGDRMGLIGPNGAGKTTLLRIIAGRLQAEEGSVTFESGASVGYLEQEVLEMSLNHSVLDVALTAFAEATRIENRLEAIFAELERVTDYESDGYSRLLDEMHRLQDRYAVLEGDRKEAKAGSVLEGLGFTTEQLHQPLSRFSGGWRMRVLLGKLLLEHPDVLLLDEPTNHLDIDSITWLEQYLQSYDGAVILVSHDRYFMDRMINQIADLRSRRVYMYPGNYEKYLELRAEQMDLQAKAWENQQKEIADTERFIQRFRAKATKARQVQSRIKAMDRMEMVEAPEADAAEVRFRFPDPPKSGKVVLTIENLRKTYPAPAPGEQPVTVFTSGQALHIEAGDKIALIGANGTGKSTLARIMDGVETFDGKRQLGYNVVLSYFAQHLADVLTSDKTVLEVMDEAAPTSEARSGIRNLLGSFLFKGDDVFKPIRVLSGGERSRVALARTLLTPANVMVLDEPTNHLDLASKNVLVQALKEFKGTLIVVSHDRHFLQGFATKIWRVGGGRVMEYDGGYDYYEWKSGKQSQESKDSGTSRAGIAGSANPVSNQQAKTAPVAKHADSGRSANTNPLPETAADAVSSKDQRRMEAQKRNELKPLRNKAAKLERQVDDLEKEKVNLENRLADPGFYQSGEAAAVIKRHSKIQSEIDEITEQWMKVLEELETAENNAM
jgi:ATP-binding cassette subfamily F protein 3